jgi:hypothetical protein
LAALGRSIVLAARETASIIMKEGADCTWNPRYTSSNPRSAVEAEREKSHKEDGKYEQADAGPS